MSKKEHKFFLAIEKFCLQNKLDIDSASIEKIVAYIKIFFKWNRVYNLISRSDQDVILERHIFEVLALKEYFLSSPKILDVGSGAGIPGIILALILPAQQIFLCDSRQKRIDFLRQVIVELQLDNCVLIDGRVEDYTPGFNFDIITSRAFASLDLFAKLTSHLADDNTKFIAMKGDVLPDEVAKISAMFQIDAIIKIKSLIACKRHLIIFSKNKS